MATRRARTTKSTTTRTRKTSTTAAAKKAAPKKLTKKAPKKKAALKKDPISVTKDIETTASTPPATSSEKKSRAFKLNGIVAVVILLLAAGIFFLKDQIVVAMVNGAPVMRWEVVRELEAQGGKDTLEALVMQKLIEQEASKQGVSISQEDLDARIAEIESQVTETGQNLDDLLELQGMTREDLGEQLRFQVMIDKLVGDAVEVTDEDVEAFIEEQKEFLQDNPDMDQVREDVRDMLSEQKKSEEAVGLTERLREEATVNYLREY